MPLLAVLPAATDVGDSIKTAHLQPSDVRGGETGSHWDVEPTVRVKQGRMRPIESDILSCGDEHRHTRSVLARVENLTGLVRSRIEVDLWRAENFIAAGRQVGSIKPRPVVV